MKNKFLVKKKNKKLYYDGYTYVPINNALRYSLDVIDEETKKNVEYHGDVILEIKSNGELLVVQ
jgi:radical SAM superfamily enzyme YgiQ (UPF0313 family)